MTVVDLALDRRTKRCVGCDETKLWREFFAQQRWEDGTMRRPRSLCKACDRVRRRESQRRLRASLKNDPKRLAEYRAQQREYNATYRRKVGKAVRGPVVPLVQRSEWLPVGPLVAAIEAEAARRNPTGHSHDGALTVVCESCGLPDRVFRFWATGERATCELGMADRALLALDLLWWEVWSPDEFPEVAALFDRDEVAA